MDILTILIGYISQIGGEKLTSDQLRDSIKAVDILSVSIYQYQSIPAVFIHKAQLCEREKS